MCGIAGQFSIDKNEIRADQQQLIYDSLYSRGPDAQGHFGNQHVDLFHTRLSILDLNKRANQPFLHHHKSRQIYLSFNGEIYNFLELKLSLENLGHRFQTTSDTEVLAAGFLQFGSRFAEQLNGMFAISIYWPQKRKLTLIRDRLGIKPLYFCEQQNSLFFSSQTSTLSHLGVKKEINRDAAVSVLKYRYNILDESVFKGVHQVLPGRIMEWTLENGRLKKYSKSYWQIPREENFSDHNLSMSSASLEFSEILSDAVRLRCRTDAPAGLFLSGGVDSSSIAVLSKNHLENAAEAFTINTQDQSDDLEFSKELCKTLGFKQNFVEIDERSYEIYPELIRKFNEPIGDSVILPTYSLARAAQEKVKVVLSGEGADEILSGYVHHRVFFIARLISKLFPFVSQQFVRNLIVKLPVDFFESFFNYPGSLGKEGVKKFLDFIGYIQSPVSAYQKLVELVPNDGFAHCEPHLGFNRYAKLQIDFWNELCHADFMNSLASFDLRFWNQNYTLQRLDQMTMANSLEARVPFLDHRLVEFTLSLKQSQKISLRQQKIILREAMKPLLPEAHRSRSKHPFQINPHKVFSKPFTNFITHSINENSNFLAEFVCNKHIKNTLNSPQKNLIEQKRIFNWFVFCEFFKES